jgi:hypothetical protein
MNKVLVTSTATGEFREFEYDVLQLGLGTVVVRHTRSEVSMKDIVKYEKRLEQLIYEFVYSLASPAPETSKEFSYYCEIQSKDDRFMKVVKKIYEDKHKDFEIGYNRPRDDR